MKQVKIHGSETNLNKCVSSLNPVLQPPSKINVTIALATDAFPQPHEGEPITLSNTKLTVTIDQAVLQLGVDAGFVTDGQKIPAVATLVLAGSNTKEGTHTYSVKSTPVVHVVPDPTTVNGRALPLTASIVLPNTVWHPKNATSVVAFSEKSAKIVATLNTVLPPPNDVITDTITCLPNGTAQVIALAAQGAAVPTTVVPITAAAVTTTTTTHPAPATTLPRTGASVLVLLALAAVMIDLGVCAIEFSRKRVRRI